MFDLFHYRKVKRWTEMMQKEYKLQNKFLPKKHVARSRLRMGFPHCIAFSHYFPWFIYVYGNKHYYFENATQCGQRMSKGDVATRLWRCATQPLGLMNCPLKQTLLLWKRTAMQKPHAETGCGNSALIRKRIANKSFELDGHVTWMQICPRPAKLEN